jgi:polyvinyl alcohol dehydrogenase (cytochrome)
MTELRSRFRAVLGGAIASGIFISLASMAFAQGWPEGGQNNENSRSQAITIINPENVGALTLKWAFTTGGDVSATPAVHNGTVYFPDWAGNFYAVNAETGALQWSNTVSSWTGVAGDYARDDPAIFGDYLILGDHAGSLATWTPAGGLSGPGAWVTAVNRLTGAVLWTTKVDSFPAAFITGSPVIHHGVVYVGVASGEEHTASTPGYPCCSSSGSVVALGLEHGKILWKTYMVPSGYSGGSVWGSTPVIDVARNSIYVGTGNNFSVPDFVETCFANNNNNPYCAASNDYFDSVVALDLTTGQVKWATGASYYDAWNSSCIQGGAACPSPQGPDYDFGGSGPNMLGPNLLGIGQKSGIYWALDPDNGNVVWQTQVGPGALGGGIEWGTAFDGTSIYVPISNSNSLPYALQPEGALVNGGSWAALNPSTGQILWQTATPGACSPAVSGYEQGCRALGPASVANGVVFVGSMDTNPQNPTMFALSAATGEVLWSYVAGSSVVAAPAIASHNSVYWGSGYSRAGGTGNNQLLAFSVQ